MQDGLVSVQRRQPLGQDGQRARGIAPRIEDFFEHGGTRQEPGPIHVQVGVKMNHVAAEEIRFRKDGGGHQKRTRRMGHHRLGPLQSGRHHGAEFHVLPQRLTDENGKAQQKRGEETGHGVSEVDVGHVWTKVERVCRHSLPWRG